MLGSRVLEAREVSVRRSKAELLSRPTSHRDMAVGPLIRLRSLGSSSTLLLKKFAYLKRYFLRRRRRVQHRNVTRIRNFSHYCYRSPIICLKRKNIVVDKVPDETPFRWLV